MKEAIETVGIPVEVVSAAKLGPSMLQLTFLESPKYKGAPTH